MLKKTVDVLEEVRKSPGEEGCRTSARDHGIGVRLSVNEEESE